MGYTGRLKDTSKHDNKGKKCVVEPNTFTDASMKANESSIVLTPLKTETLRHSVDAIPHLTTTSQLYQGYVGEKAVERGMAAQVLERWVHRAKCARYNKNEGLGTAYPPFETEIGINPVIKGAFLSDDDLTSITRQVHNTGDFEVFGGPNVGDIEAKRVVDGHDHDGVRGTQACHLFGISPGIGFALSTDSAKSLDDSDSFATNESTPPTSPDIATGEHTPSPKPNHLSGYFKYSTKPAAPVEPEPTPMIPQRSPTHTKNNSVDAVARSQSISRISRDSDLSAASRSLQAFSRTPSVSAFEAFVFFGRKVDDLFCGASFLRIAELVIM
ncbi:hypothetical protein N5P37_002992 [Trichoderma harzianum]|nr:hypothetical protein N5P37_002992 [Trichoderma harzianum]